MVEVLLVVRIPEFKVSYANWIRKYFVCANSISSFVRSIPMNRSGWYSKDLVRYARLMADLSSASPLINSNTSRASCFVMELVLLGSSFLLLPLLLPPLVLMVVSYTCLWNESNDSTEYCNRFRGID